MFEVVVRVSYFDVVLDELEAGRPTRSNDW
jgi:hypothetical protein